MAAQALVGNQPNLVQQKQVQINPQSEYQAAFAKAQANLAGNQIQNVAQQQPQMPKAQIQFQGYQPNPQIQPNPQLQTPQNNPPAVQGAPNAAAPNYNAYPNAPEAPKQVLLPGQRADLSFDPNYVPNDINAATNPSLSKDVQQKYLANFYKSKGLPFNPDNIAMSPEEEAQNLLKQQKENMTELEKQVYGQETKIGNQKNANEAAIQSQFAVNREGPQSVSNQLVPQQATQAMDQEYQLQVDSLNGQVQNLQKLQAQQQQNWVAGRDDQIAQMQKNIADAQTKLQDSQNSRTQQTTQMLTLLDKNNVLAGLDPQSIAYLQAGMPGVPQGVLQALTNSANRNVATDQQKQQLTALDSFKTLAQAGVSLSPQLMIQQANSTGLPVESLMQFNQAAQQVMQDKSLTNEQKAGEVQKLGYELDQKQRGIFNEAQQNVDFLSQLYKQGATSEMISAFKSAAHITDTQDPKYQADLQARQIENNIKQKQANGQPVTPQDWNTWADAQQKLNALGLQTPGSNNAYIPTKPIAGMKVAFDNGVLSVQTPVGINGKPVPFQCGAGVNRCWGLSSGGNGGLPSSYTGKQALVNNNGIKTSAITDPDTQIVPGMAFVMPIAGKYAGEGHTGLVKQNLGGGKFLTAEWNWDGKGGYSEQVRDYSQMYGFAKPPQNKVQQTGVEQGISKISYKQYGLLSNTDFNPTDQTDKYAQLYLQNYIKNGAIPSARALGISTSKGAASVFSDAANRANDLIYAATGQSLPDVQLLKNNKVLLEGNNKLLNNLNIQEKTVSSNFKLALDNMQKNDLNGGWQAANKAWLSLQNAIGDPAAAQYISQNATLQNELGNLIAIKNASGTTVHDKLESAGLLPKDASVQQQRDIITTMMQEAENGRNAIQGANEDLYKQIDPLEMLTQNPGRQKSINVSNAQAAAPQISQGIKTLGQGLQQFNPFGVKPSHLGYTAPSKTPSKSSYTLPNF